MARGAGKSLSLLLLIAAVMIHLCLMPVKSYVVEGGESPYPMGKLRVTHLHFYLQDFISGNNATAAKVAGAKEGRTTASPFMFGDVYVIDDHLTGGVDPGSKVIGNAQGIYAFTGRDRLSLYLAVDFGFTTGEYNGSSISVASRNPISDSTRELTVVGGRGRFRFARGFALLTTRYMKGLDATIEYNVTVLHY